MKSTPHKLRNVDKTQFRRLYWEEKKNLREIGEMFGVSSPTMTRWFDKLGIPRRNGTAAQYLKNATPIAICKECGQEFRTTAYRQARGHGQFCSRRCDDNNRRVRFRGRNNHNWQGGITPAVRSVRRSARYIEWRDSIFRRDDFTCQECAARCCVLNAHHETPFSVIWRALGIKTAEEAFACDELWDLGNVVTLCLSCHDQINHWALGARDAI